MENTDRNMKDEFHETSNINNTMQPVVVFGIGVIPPNNQLDHEHNTLLLPIGRECGTYEELRERLHKQVDMLFDSIL